MLRSLTRKTLASAAPQRIRLPSTVLKATTLPPRSLTTAADAKSSIVSGTTSTRRTTQLANQLSAQPFSTIDNMAHPTTDSEEWHRLPKHIVPEHYDLIIKSDLQNLTFHGLVTINVNIVDDTDIVTLNAASKLTLSKVKVTSDALKTDSVITAPLTIDAAHERATAKLAQKLPKGSKATIAVSFASHLDNSMAGYYRSSYEHEGKKGFYGLTQFEPTAARRAFPCFDEPGLKATYSFRMIHRKDTVPLANMPVTKEAKPISADEQDKLLRITELELDASNVKSDIAAELETQGKTESGDWAITEFDSVPKVSTYLVAWANGNFVHLEGSYKSPLTGKDIKLRVYATPDNIHQAQFGLDVKAKCMPEYEKVFDIPFPLPKLDTLVAADFDAGAMENWGLITGRTSAYLCDTKTSGLQTLKGIAGTQSHECAHQWFGNITTMEWWSGLWLNESFATLMGEVIILDKIFPEWDSSSEFIGVHLARALELDAKRSSHPIEVPLKGENVESAINEIFDAISYSKGASVLRMLSKVVGEEVFLKGVSIYLKKHLYANAVTNDLWEGISESSGLDISKIMGKWILEQGFPVLTVTEGENEITVKQNRFLATGDVKPEEDKTLWYVPLELKSVGADGKASVDRALALNEERERTFPLKDVKNASWKLNADTVGVYRVAYSPERMGKLGAEAAKANSGFSLEDRVGLLSDAHTLAKAGHAKTSGVLTFLKTIANEPTFLVNSGALSSLGDMQSVWYEEPQEVQDALSTFIAEFFGPKAKDLGFEQKDGESVDRRQLRLIAISGAASGKDEWTLQEIKRRFAQHAGGDDSAISGDLLTTVYSNAVKHGGATEYDQILAIYRKPKTPAHKISAIMAMCATQDPALMQRTFDFVYTPKVREQDYLYFFRGLSARNATRRPLWENTKKRYPELVQRFTGGFVLTRLIEGSFCTLASEKDASDVEQFFSDKDNAKYQMGLNQGLEGVRTRAAWLERDREDLRSWLATQGYLKA